MILSNTVKVGLGGRNIKHYEDLGYKIPRYKDNRGRILWKKGTKIEVLLKDVMRSDKTKVLCKCEDCGQERYVQYDTLINRLNSSYNKTKETLCRDCANKRMSGKNNSNYKHGCDRYCEYKNNARKRGLEFNLSVEEFKELISQECHYCGGFSTEHNPKSRGNGIDRKNSDVGYLIENCIPCCATCNFIKNTTSYNDFVNYIKRVYRRLIKNEIQK